MSSFTNFFNYYMDVSENGGTSKSSILNMVFHYFHHPFWGTPIFGKTHMSYGRNYLFGEYAFTKCGGSPIGSQGFGCSGHQHQNRSMRFTVWDDFICYMIENCRRASQDERVPFDSKCRYNYKIFECALVHLGYTYYRHLWKHEKEDSTFFGSQQGQQTMNFELCSKPFLPQSGM